MSSDVNATPIRRQYLEIKRKYPDCIVFFRLGDFFETFDADAELIARELNVTLTSRPVGKDTRVPMAGVPHHAINGYVARLIERGYRVAMADQLGSEAINGLVPREVKHVITPGTVIEPGMLEAGRPSYLAAIAREPNDDPASPVGLAFCDITTGEFRAAQVENAAELERELGRIQPREILTEGGEDGRRKSLPISGFPSTPYPSYRFEFGNAKQALMAHFKVSTLAGFGLDDRPLAVRAAGAILAYLREMQPAQLAQLTELRAYSLSQFMGLDAVTRRNLELTEPLRGEAPRRRRGPSAQPSAPAPTLLGVLDKTLTPMGARLLRAWISQPLLDQTEIEARLDRVAALHADGLGRAQLRQTLNHMPDLERLTTRAASGIATPKDLLNMGAALEKWELINSPLPPGGAGDAVRDLIAKAIKPEPDDDGFINPGFSEELDGIHLASRDAKVWVANLERTERERTGIKSLKVSFNSVFGYYIEVTHANTGAVPADYIRKQTLTNAERYITPQLKEYEALILNADERISKLEQRLLREVNEKIAAQAAGLMAIARAIAQMDAQAALAEAAANNNYTRPRFNDDGVIEIKDGRHPVIEQLMVEVPFTPNDTAITRDERILIVTGPNMSGKSSYMRQVALICLMAQMGSFVPARSANLCVADRIFTRIGAQDELTAGQSTFMVEMVEAANILRHCTPRSLVLLDEIGRGTSTYDGLAIAWSVIEYLHNHPDRRAMTLFATHYHELIQLAEKLPHVRNYNVAVSEDSGETVVFLHKVIPGGADRSYGIHVAQLAGMPSPVVSRAQDILKQLENGTLQVSNAPQAAPVQLNMFTPDSPALAKLKSIDPDAMSPIEALTALYELKKLTKK